MAKVQRPSQFKMITFLKKATDSRRKFGSDRNGNPNYGREAVSFFSLKKLTIDKILAVRLQGSFWARNKVGCSFGFGLWAWPLEASLYGCLGREAVGVHGQRFRLWTWPLQASHYARPKAPFTIMILLAIYLQPISLDSQQSLATQSHGLSTWTAIVWSGP
jgi:hypothetical protein